MTTDQAVAPGNCLASAAALYVGVPFRLHGRDPSIGLDCIGLVHASLCALGRQPALPTGYRLRNASIERWMRFAERSGFERTNGTIRRGDVLLIEPGPAQHHLVVVEDTRCAIHAHAGLRRVVRQAMAFPERSPGHWRLF